MKKLTEKDAIWCKTQKQWDSIIKKFKIKSIDHKQWLYSYQKSCIRPITENGKPSFMDLVFYKNKGYTIHKAKDILKKSFKKDVLKRLDKIEKVISDNTVVSKIEPLKFDFPTKELEELPEKWCILCTEENSKILNKYLHENKEKYRLYNSFWIVDAGGYFVSENQNRGHTIADEYPKEYTEITFDQFKKWVLKEEEKPLSIREVQVKVSSQEEANECAEIAKACGEEIWEIEIIEEYCYFRKQIKGNDFGVFRFTPNYKEISLQEFRERFGKKQETEIDWSKAGQLVVDYGNRTFILTDGIHCGDSFSGVIVGGDLWYKGTNHQDWSKTNFGLCRASITLKNE